MKISVSHRLFYTSIVKLSLQHSSWKLPKNCPSIEKWNSSFGWTVRSTFHEPPKFVRLVIFGLTRTQVSFFHRTRLRCTLLTFCIFSHTKNQTPTHEKSKTTKKAKQSGEWNSSMCTQNTARNNRSRTLLIQTPSHETSLPLDRFRSSNEGLINYLNISLFLKGRLHQF